MSEDRKQYAEQLLNVANDAARAAGSRLARLLTVGAYVMITVLSTSDAMLVRASPVLLPVLNVNVPISGFFGFFSVAPWLILLMHCDVLLQMEALNRKLLHLRAVTRDLEKSEQDRLRERLASFYYVQFLVGEGPSDLLQKLAGVVLGLTVIAFPLALLLGIQVRFLPFHSEGFTWFHRLAVVLDVVLILWVWPQLSPRTRRAGEQRLQRRRWLPGRSLVPEALAPACLGLVIIGLSVMVATVPGTSDRASRLEPRNPQSPNEVLATTAWSPEIMNEVAQAFHGGQEWWFTVRNLRLQNEVLTAPELSPEVVNALRLGGAREKDAELAKVSPLAFFQGRDLRHGNFFNAVLPKFDFRSVRADPNQVLTTQLNGADFRWAQLQQVLLNEADAREVLLDGAQLQEASLDSADLSGATMVGTQLQHAKLRAARLANAKADRVMLQGADLSGAQLMGATLTEAHLEGASLRGANLEGAVLDNAILEAADLTGATLSGATFKNAKMKGVILTDARVDRADFTDADLDLTDVLSVRHEPGVMASAFLADAFKGAEFHQCLDQQAAIFKQCKSKITSEERLQHLADHWADVACRDAYAARGLSEQAGLNSDLSRSALAPALAACLSQQTCRGVALLDRSTQENLERAAQQTRTAEGAYSVGLTCGARSPTAVNAARAKDERGGGLS